MEKQDLLLMTGFLPTVLFMLILCHLITSYNSVPFIIPTLELVLPFSSADYYEIFSRKSLGDISPGFSTHMLTPVEVKNRLSPSLNLNCYIHSAVLPFSLKGS